MLALDATSTLTDVKLSFSILEYADLFAEKLLVQLLNEQLERFAITG